MPFSLQELVDLSGQPPEIVKMLIDLLAPRLGRPAAEAYVRWIKGVAETEGWGDDIAAYFTDKVRKAFNDRVNELLSGGDSSIGR